MSSLSGSWFLYIDARVAILIDVEGWWPVNNELHLPIIHCPHIWLIHLLPGPQFGELLVINLKIYHIQHTMQ